MTKITHLTDENTDITYEIADEYARSRLDSIPSGISESASGSTAVFTDGAALPLKSLSVDFGPVQSLNGYDYPWVGGTGKNLLPNNASSSIDHEVTFTVNSDGSITANGTATGGNASCVVAADISIPTGDGMIITGCPSGGSSTTYDCRVLANSGTYYNDYGSGKAIPSGLIITRSIIVIRSGQTVSDLTFYPMVRVASEADATYEPYENICPIEKHTNVTITRTSKNKLPKGWTTSTSNGITVTANSDGTVTANGTASSTATFAFNIDMTLDEDMILTGCPEGGGSSKYVLWARTTSNSYKNDYGSGVTITSGTSLNRFAIVILSGQTVSNLVFKPMLRAASIADASYDPYASDTYTVSMGTNNDTYKGVFDITTGILSITHKMIIYDGVTEGKCFTSVGTKGETQNYYNFYGAADPDGSLYNRTTYGWVNDLNIIDQYGLWSSHGGIIKAATADINEFNKVSTILYVNSAMNLQARMTFPEYMNIVTVRDANTWLANQYSLGTPVQILYALREPVEIQLATTEIMALLGSNIVTADTGNVAVEYTADTKLYIDKKIAELSQGS